MSNDIIGVFRLLFTYIFDTEIDFLAKNNRE